ncbi:MAG: DUF1934 domain-containing protein [Eubacteriales bacterium]|nr:DUF1934 domain-containing protein [Eubacteriales bacterium]
MLEIPVLVSIQSIAHRDEEADEPVTLITSGLLSLEQDDKAIIRYDESLDEALPPQHVTITIESETVAMNRDGDYISQLVFRKGQRYEGQYATPFGEMALAIFCTRLRYQLDENGGEIQLSYQMDLNGQFAAMQEMEIRLMRQNG